MSIDSGVAEKVFKHKVIDDWPCYIDPECDGVICSSTKEGDSETYELSCSVVQHGESIEVDGGLVYVALCIPCLNIPSTYQTHGWL